MHAEAGHTLLELLVVLALLPILLAASFEALASAHRSYLRQLGAVEAREATRVALDVLTAELRAASPTAGDLYAIAPDSVALRSTIGIGFVCGVPDSSLALWRSSGLFTPSPTDSVLIFSERDPADAGDDTVVAARIAAVRSGGDPECPGGQPSDRRLLLDPPVSGIATGSPLRAFRPYVYRLYRSADGGWWLGQRLRGGVIQPVTGPFAPPGEGGLALEYAVGDGSPAARPQDVARIRIVARSRVPRRMAAGGPYIVDSLAVVIAPRNR